MTHIVTAKLILERSKGKFTTNLCNNGKLTDPTTAENASTYTKALSKLEIFGDQRRSNIVR